MKGIEEIRSKLEGLKPLLREKFNVRSIGFFGSYAREEQKGRKSDLDILVVFSKPIGLFKFIELEDLLSHRLGVKVDLVMRDALKPGIREKVLKEAVYA